ncbi:MAG: D-alanyl-D-alanine carboxypeptidase/D-alanyl-D-alanine-endopeptidase [Bacteroidota bacterium]|nr:D-alanyl-D-alanine carboxypeptidase/D-alanyl-D-alanine-endopeptidase [Bacteroidota bacterium]
MRNIRGKFFFIILIAAFCLAGISPVGIKKEIDRLNADTVLAHGDWGFCMITADSGKLIASHNMQQSLIPASTLKTLTTGAALALLGAEYKYETKIEYDGIYDSINGIIKGNIYIRGSGDPTFNSARFNVGDTISVFQSLPSRLLGKGIKKIEGNIIGDASCFSDNPVPDGWTWSDLGQYYGAGTCGLTYSDNSVKLYFDSSLGDSCILTKTSPVPENVIYRSDVTSDGKKDEALVYGAPYGNMYYVHGSIPAGKKNFEVKASHPDPAYQCAKDFYEELKPAISVSGKPTTVRRMQLANEKISIKRKILTIVYSVPLRDIVAETNLHSDNLYAEQLLRTLGLVKGNGGTTEDGIEVVKNYWKSLGINIDGLYMTDGSGLSRSNGITTLIQATILQKASQQKWYPYFLKSLPVAGRTGSMSSLCKGTLAENNLQAKTGYINRARGYAGYVKSKSGKLLCFSLLANNYSCSAAEMKKRLERILVAMAEN